VRAVPANQSAAIGVRGRVSTLDRSHKYLTRRSNVGAVNHMERFGGILAGRKLDHLQGASVA
jgi:hypothetical protein